MNIDISDPTPKELRSFGLITGAIAAVLFGLVLPWVFSGNYPTWPWVVGGGLALFAMVAPLLLKPIYHMWMRIGAVLGWINTRIILGLIFYLIFTPFRVAFLILGKDPMSRKLDASAESYRVKSLQANRENMENPF